MTQGVHTWTDGIASIDAEALLCDAVEIDTVEVVPDPYATGAGYTSCDRGVPVEKATFFSCYLHYSEQGGTMCVADRDTLEQARAYALFLSHRYGLRIVDCVGERVGA